METGAWSDRLPITRAGLPLAQEVTGFAASELFNIDVGISIANQTSITGFHNDGKTQSVVSVG
jgi:hypothetical protein